MSKGENKEENKILSIPDFLTEIDILIYKVQNNEMNYQAFAEKATNLVKQRDKAICKAQKETCNDYAEIEYMPPNNLNDDGKWIVEEDSILNAPDAI